MPRTAALDRANAAFARWADDLLTGRIRTQGRTSRAGRISPDIAAFLERKGVALADRDIRVEDWRIKRMLRTAKGDRALPAALVKRMPEVLDKPQAVLWDKRKENLLYVFDLPDDGRKGKFIVEVQYQFGRGDKKSFGPTVVSGGRVPHDALVNENAYETVLGNL